MADSTLTALTAAAALDGTELYYTVQGGADRKVTGAQIGALALTIGNIVTLGTPASVLFEDTTSVATTRQIANRGCLLAVITAGAGQANTQTYHFARDDITSIQVGWVGWYVNGSGVETANTGTNTITAALWVDGNAHQILFSAVATGTIPNGGTLISDVLTVDIPAGAKFYIRTYHTYSVAQLSREKATSTRDTTNGDAVNHTAADQTMSGSVTDAGGAIAGLWPSLLLGSSTRPAILLIGDSRCSGETTDSYSDGAGYLGNTERSVGPSFATLNAAKNGDEAQFFASRVFTATLFTYFSHVICEYGINDADNGANGATILTRFQAIYAMFSGQKIFQNTLEPVTTSTDGWVTLVNQTVYTGETARLVVNAAVRAGLANTEGYFDIASTLESSLNSGFWKVPAYTIDGLHASQFGCQQVALSEIIPPGSFVGSSVVLAEDNAHFNYSPGSRTLHATNVEAQTLSFGPGAIDSGDVLILGTDNAVEALEDGLFKVDNTTATNWFVGQAGNRTVTGAGNSGFGAAALRAVTTGFNNVAMGSLGLFVCTTGESNVAVGDSALAALTSGQGNIGVGALSGSAITNAVGNVAIGLDSYKAGNGSYNTAIGYGALQNTVSGNYNTAIGLTSVDNINGSLNVAVGPAGRALTSGDSNSILGAVAFDAATSGSYNVIVGYSAGVNITSGDYNTLVGGWKGPASTLSNMIALSDGQENLRLDYGYTNAATWTFAKALCVTPVAVASLPTAGIMGRRHFVTDATATTFASIVAGTGGNPVPVYDDGTNWRIG